MAEMTKRDIESGKTRHCQCVCGKEWHRPAAAYCYNCGAELKSKEKEDADVVMEQ